MFSAKLSGSTLTITGDRALRDQATAYVTHHRHGVNDQNNRGAPWLFWPPDDLSELAVHRVRLDAALIVGSLPQPSLPRAM